MFTKWIEYKPLVKYTLAKAVEFMQYIVHRFSMPNWIITDLGSPFIAIEFKSWAHDCGMSIDYALVAHLKANGQMKKSQCLVISQTQTKAVWFAKRL
jgi:hypothetical protein